MSIGMGKMIVFVFDDELAMVAEGLEIPELVGPRVRTEGSSRARELSRRLVFAIGVDNLGPLLTLGLGLQGHGALHRGRQLDILDFDRAYLDPPRGSVCSSIMRCNSTLSCSRLARISSMSDWPRMLLSVVWAICDVALI